MQKHPMLSVKEAAAALGCDERWIREKLNLGLMKGEKRNIGLKEKWFVYKGEIDAALAKKSGQALGKPPPQADETTYFGVEPESETIDAEEVHDNSDTEASGVSTPTLEDVVRVIANQFAERLDQQKEFNFRLQRELEEKDRQLRLLPDLQRQAAEVQNKELEMAALRKQVAAMEVEYNKAQFAMDRVQELETRVLPTLEMQVAEEKQAKADELSRLEAKVADLELERIKAEEARRKVSELEEAMARLKAEESARQDRDVREMELLREQKEAHNKVIQEQLSAMQVELKKLKAPPWWKKFLGLGENDG